MFGQNIIFLNNVIMLIKNHKIHFIMSKDKYVCEVCDWVYDPEKGDPDNGIAPGTSFEDLPDDWVCPLCGVGKDQFAKVD